METWSEAPLTQNELVSINALVDFLAERKGFNRENSHYLLETEFRVSTIRHIKRCDLERAIALLVDLHNLSVH